MLIQPRWNSQQQQTSSCTLNRKCVIIGTLLASGICFTNYRYGKNRHINSRYIADPIIGTPLLLDFDEAESNAFSEAFGKEINNILRGCSVHFLRSAMCVWQNW